MAATRPSDFQKKAKKKRDQQAGPVTSATDWKSGRKGQTGTYAVALPSGNTARLRRADLQTFISLGIIPNSMLKIVQKQIERSRKGKPQNEEKVSQEFEAMIEDPQKLADVIMLADNITVYVVVEPKVLPVPDDEEDRDAEALYIDEVDMGDKMFIFNWAMGGSPDAETFLDEPTKDVGSVSAGENVGR